MPQLLELREEPSLHSRFSFLNVVDQESVVTTDHANTSRDSNRSNTNDTITSKQTLKNPSLLAREADLIPHNELIPLFVVKTAIEGVSKLFINVTGLKASSSRPAEPAESAWISEVTTDVDKAGKICRVITVAISNVTLPESQIAENVISAIRDNLQLNIGTDYSLPKMRKKGTLSSVTLHTCRMDSKILPQPEETGKSLITELDSPVVKSNAKSASKTQHKVELLTRAILSMPLPTMYTHRVSFPLRAAQSERSSWSVYYDSQDSTLKILLPPEEEFTTIAVQKDDFRAFSRAGQLQIFYVG